MPLSLLVVVIVVVDTLPLSTHWSMNGRLAWTLIRALVNAERSLPLRRDQWFTTTSSTRHSPALPSTRLQ